MAQAEMLSTILKNAVEVDQGPIGQIDDQRLRELIRAIGYVLDAECEPT